MNPEFLQLPGSGDSRSGGNFDRDRRSPSELGEDFKVVQTVARAARYSLFAVFFGSDAVHFVLLSVSHQRISDREFCPVHYENDFHHGECNVIVTK